MKTLDVTRRNKAQRIVDNYKKVLITWEFGTPIPAYFATWPNRILSLEYLIIDLKYK